MTENLIAFLEKPYAKILIEVASVKGSTPREAGAFMLVSSNQQAGTIGGGQLEYMAIDHARALLSGKDLPLQLDIPLGPEIGQCCGGRVEITFEHVTDQLRDETLVQLRDKLAAQPQVHIFGAGHVGHALARTFALLPFNVTVVETREAELVGLPEGITPLLTPMPESLAGNIPAGSAILILTHDHALDFLIGAEALKRNDLAYIGMIGSATKRATFANWLKREAPNADISRLTMPIGGPLKDKRPEVIAALAAAEVSRHIVEYDVRSGSMARATDL